MQKQNRNLLGIVPDIHFRENLSYSDYIKDNRLKEESEVLDFIIESFEDCQKIVFVGDVFNNVNPSSSVIKKATNFIDSLVHIA